MPLPLLGPSAPGQGMEELKTQKNGGWSHSCSELLPFLFFSALSGVEPSRSAKAFLQGGPKSLQKFRIFHHFETLRPYISETIKNRGI